MSQYIFTGSQPDRELQRLQAIERVFDPASQKRLQATDILTGWQCLEVGAGAGSMVQWLASVVGEKGKVVAVDLNTRWLANQTTANVETIEADIRHLSLDEQSFDLIHARYVFIHLQDPQGVLSRLWTALKPGGWLVIEEPDFTVARAIAGEEKACQAVNRVNMAIGEMFAARGLDAAFGVKLPAILQKYPLQQLRVENDSPLAQGGSGIAKVMKMSARQLASQYAATGKTSNEDIQQYCQFADNPNTWAIYYATIGAIAQKAINSEG